MLRFLLILALCAQFASCGKKEEKVDNAILRANLALTRGDCDSAISILELEGYQAKNADYIKTLSSAYACKAGYKTTVLFGTDLPKVSDPDMILRDMSTFTTSTMDSLDNSAYLFLQRGLENLLYAGGISTAVNPTSADRSAIFGSKGMDLNSFAFYLSLAQLGNFSFYFGNASFVTGIKGAGNDTSTNPCYLDYNANVNAFLDTLGDTGNCVNGSDEGHPDLVDGVDLVNVENACKGITLFNNFVDTLDSFIGTFTGDDFSEFANISTAVEVAKLGITVVKPTFDTRIFDTTSQQRCENLFAGNDEDIMYFYAAVFETLHR
ncbi:hypothetical protein BIY24_12480 [Halobacteriovorax marinus]|nr:hypothetical protein [Halobacteriovorax marinus]ATH08733.1 hypothetical protein BIY24_12480 [Halobacteriovorax marinus]